MSIKDLYKIDKKLTHFKYILALIEWDSETGMSEMGGEERGEEAALISSLAHQTLCSDDVRECLDKIDFNSLESDVDKALYNYYKRELERKENVPSSLIEEKSRLIQKSKLSWLEAREEDDFSLFEDDLSHLIDILREEASLCSPEKDPYDVLLSDFELGICQKDIDGVFDNLEKSIHSIMDKIHDGCKKVDSSFLYSGYDADSLEKFCRYISLSLGFDFSRGVIGKNVHPFTTALGPDDIRITNRFTDDGLFDPIGSIIHETGHALFEMHASNNPLIRGTSLSGTMGMALHESQSRLFENFIARSSAFWHYHYKTLQDYIPQLSSIPLESFIKAINKAESSAIRVNADELTYSLHIIMRYRLEKALMNKSLRVKDIPEAWREESLKTVRYKVKNDREGCLQDIHWADGLFGYFPSYALGNIYAAMIFDAMKTSLGGSDAYENMLKEGDYSEILSFLDANIWSKGGVYTSKDLLLNLTGEVIGSDAYKNYLDAKFTSLFI